MSGSSDPELLRRLVDFQLELKRDSSEDVDEFEWGRLIYNPRTAAIWSDNFLEVDSGEIDADRLVTLADELLGGRGLKHRYVVPRDPQHARAARAALQGARLGCRSQSLHGAAPTARSGGRHPQPRSPARRSRRFDGRSRKTTRTSPATPSSSAPCATHGSTRRQRPLVRGARGWGAGRLLRALRARWDRPGGDCGDKARGSGQGLASAVVLAASDASRRAGHELTFIVADADDWPWKLYERLGFDPIGETSDFLRKPPQLSGESP